MAVPEKELADVHIQFIEIRNFRKLKSVRVELADETTLFVGANNSGKTSAMDALRYFLVDKSRFSTKDFTLSNWIKIKSIGASWESEATSGAGKEASMSDWSDVLPTLDLWLFVPKTEIHYVSHLLPTLKWKEGVLGIRLQYEPENLGDLKRDYLAASSGAKETVSQAKKDAQPQEAANFELWPRTLEEFLDRRLGTYFTTQAYILDPSKIKTPNNGVAQPQELTLVSDPLDIDPFRGLIRVDFIGAQRGFSDVEGMGGQGQNVDQRRDSGGRRKLSEQLRQYYKKHLDPSDLPEPADVPALQAIEEAQVIFNKKLKESFASALDELESLGYPGFTNPKLTLSTRIQPIDSLNHGSAVEYDVINQGGVSSGSVLRLPEEYNGLGYQNLISIVFKLMGFRDERMQVGKAAKRELSKEADDIRIAPLHLVLIEEPEAHLHAQVQQVFIRRAFAILRNHINLGSKKDLETQLVISTHSSHMAHESEFSSLRYFRRKPAACIGEVPTSTVINLSDVFGKQGKTERFSERYLKTTHCDLFFADAAILVEGPAERMLLPQFISQDFEELNQSYISILEIGGSHAHRLRPLIESLGLTSLIITDLDAAESRTRWPAAQPRRNSNMVTRNTVLRTWIPKKKKVDELYALAKDARVMIYDESFSVRVAYQTPVAISFKTATPVEAFANTFEDALVFDNVALFSSLAGHGLISKFRVAVEKSATVEKLGDSIFDCLKDGNKAELALDLLFRTNPTQLKTPSYIREGLEWLQSQLELKRADSVEVKSAAG